MNEHACSSPEELGSILLLDPDHPSRVAAEACPRCHATLTAFQDFLDAKADDRARYTSTDAAELDRRRARLLRGANRPRPRIFAPVMLPAWGLAAAAVLLLAVQLRSNDPESSTALRGAAGTHAVPSLSSLDSGDLLFAWPDRSDVESFSLQFLDAELREVKQLHCASRTQLQLSAVEVNTLWQDSARLWRLLGLAGGDVLYRSPLTALPPLDTLRPAEKNSAEP